MRAAVVGHVEWVEFALVERVPQPGEIVHAAETWAEPAGGGAVAAVQLMKLAGAATLFTTFGDDELGHRSHQELQALGLEVQATFRPEPQRRCFTYIDGTGERTITTIGNRLSPAGTDALSWEQLTGADAVYFCAGDAGALEAARRAAVLVATARILPDLIAAPVRLDALVGSARDEGERYEPGMLEPPPGLVVATEGAGGGTYRVEGGTAASFPPSVIPGPTVDAYGCGDSFVAGLTYALGAGYDVAGALELAARCGAACLTGRGPYAGQFRLV
jgi:ribokinase